MNHTAQSACALPSELTIYTVGELYPHCLAWLGRPLDATDPAGDQALRVAAAGVEEVDAAGVQLLLSLANALAQQRRQLQLVEPSDALRRACESLGVAALTAAAEPAEAML